MKEQLDEKELYVNFKTSSREIRENLKLWIEIRKGSNGLALDEFFAQVNKDRAIKIKPDSDIVKAYTVVFDAIEYLNRRMDEQGMELIEKALELDPENEEALKIKLDVFGYRRQYNEVEAISNKLISMKCLNPSFYADAYRARSNIKLERAFEQKNRQLANEALHFAEEGLKSEKDNYDLLMLKAGILYHLGRREYREWIEKAHTLDRRRTELFMEHYWIKEKLL